ncbi:hypothetical protein PAHAL_2G471100 [Panicum hallii]|uniref:pectinesterase n=1 Tax=Panicum hallii TaxID=206008 RepID=A0A2S3H300_9POAL|nr:hypothetical protein PAHAL_2G471100 [Panicum hallii]
MQPFWFSRSSSSSLPLLLVLLLRLSTPSLARAPVSRTITVHRQGRGDFRTVQSAVDSVPDGNRNWIKIHVNAGSYWEKVTIPPKKRYILLEGAGSSRTDISFNANAHAGIDQIMRRPNVSVDELSPTFRSATFTVLADNFVARDISFKDTLCDFRGRHYFRRCLVRGGVDFVFGYGQSIYEDCVLVSAMPPGPQPGWLTAHARLDAGSPGGLVFKGGAVTGTGRIYLGRAWNGYATVVFYGARMDHVVVPQGWQAWNCHAHDMIWAKYLFKTEF